MCFSLIIWVHRTKKWLVMTKTTINKFLWIQLTNNYKAKTKLVNKLAKIFNPSFQIRIFITKLSLYKKMKSKKIYKLNRKFKFKPNLQTKTKIPIILEDKLIKETLKSCKETRIKTQMNWKKMISKNMMMKMIKSMIYNKLIPKLKDLLKIKVFFN